MGKTNGVVLALALLMGAVAMPCAAQNVPQSSAEATWIKDAPLPSPSAVEEMVSRGDLAKAEAALKQIQARTKAPKAYYALGSVYAKELKWAEAEEQFVYAQKLDPTLSFAPTKELFLGQLVHIEKAKKQTVGQRPQAGAPVSASAIQVSQMTVPSAGTDTQAKWFIAGLVAFALALLTNATARNNEE